MPNLRGTSMTGLAALLLALAAGGGFRAQEAAAPAPAASQNSGDGAKTGDSPAPEESAEALLSKVTTRDMEEAIRGGLKALAKLQDAEKGCFGGEGVRVANTALCGMALLASGSLPNSGPYGVNIAKTVDYLLANQDPNNGYFTSPEDRGSRIHGHGYATQFLSQVYGASPDSVKLRSALTRAVRLLEAGQTPNGGWGYVPDDLTWDEGSTTICALQALRAAQSAGITVKNETIAKAIGYIEKIATPHTIKGPDGKLMQTYTFMYSLSSGSSSQSWPLVAAGCASLNNVGVYSKHARWDEKNLGAILDGGMRWLKNGWGDMLDNNAAGGGGGVAQHYFYYANLYAAQACWQYSDLSYFKEYFPKVRDLLVAEHKRNGGQYWPHGSYGTAFGTSIALLILQVPYQYLPCFQR